MALLPATWALIPVALWALGWLAAVAGAVVLITWVRALVERTDGVPGPFPWPLIGNLLQWRRFDPLMVHTYMADLARKYGPVARFVLGMESYVLVSGVDAMQSVLGNPGYKAFDRGVKEQYVARG